MRSKYLPILLLTFSCFFGCEKEQAPFCEILSPIEGAKIPTGESVNLSVLIENEGGLIKEARYFVNDSLITSVNEFPYSYLWNNIDLDIGKHELKVILLDDNNSEGSASIDFLIVEKDADELYDARDGQSYKTVKIGEQWWMAENFAYLPEVGPPEERSVNSEKYYVIDYYGSSVIEARNTDNFQKYGVIYNYDAAKLVCPEGWRLANDNDWEDLARYLKSEGGYQRDGQYWHDIGKHMKISTGWMDNGNGTDDYNFSALPGGSYYWAGNEGWKFSEVGKVGYWWSDPVAVSCHLYLACILQSKNDIFIITAFSTEYGFSVRCVKEN